ncbi:TIGR00730 family Rossman fold protein [Gammaproteobacteria bacterium AB-CW1]|uniref:Cytokinin riboside 5'-monophosphate phosphoribohydrolase n=1 Tax=Natronospira elongata TaxID=3110268 RepID=A0AAP6MLK9_9GAMM|nr:TIGR00730 family Rossman fold protein [Gammaproteobacteria bacterium AB-CW1]
MSNVCVFCGSRHGRNPDYTRLAHNLGAALAEQGHGLVYGGGRVGLMGVMADAAMAAGGKVLGVIPESLESREVGHRNITRLEVVSDMLSRKQRMIELSDAFIALAGGLGTLDELFEVLTWRQLGLIDEPIILLDPFEDFTGIRSWMDHACRQGFMDPEHRDMLVVAHSPQEALEQLTPRAAAS